MRTGDSCLLSLFRWGTLAGGEETSGGQSAALDHKTRIQQPAAGRRPWHAALSQKLHVAAKFHGVAGP